MSDLLTAALIRRDALKKELAAVEQLILSYTQASKQLDLTAGVGDLFPEQEPARRRGRRRSHAEAVARMMDDAEQLIVRAGRPLTRSELLKLLTERGHTIEGGDKSKVLGTNLWRSRRFYNLKGAGYWPINRPIPEPYRSKEQRPSMLL
ncbi:MAG: hypothetical protein ACOY7L_18260 [Pseudomonadota bacterium]